MADMMTFPDTVEEFMEQYKITDTEQIYTNGTELVPIFRMRQWFDHKPEHKTGRWMFGFNNQYLQKYYYCSNCGCRKYEEEEPSDYFCSNCGADMRGGEKE